VSPASVHYFEGAVLPLLTVVDILLPALATFLIVALTEEGLRYILLRVWVRFSSQIDQVFDGLVIGVAAGIGFATLENTVYFLNLFQQGNFDTLVFVFFLRFLISTLAHITFGGLMGTLIAQGAFDLYSPRRYYVRAFFLPWLLHGLYDLMLGVNQSFYAVLLLLPGLWALVVWQSRREFFTLHRKDGRFLVQEQAPQTARQRTVEQVASSFRSPWNKHAPWMAETQARRALTSETSSHES
jgi:RsiW-degrading membrane proteinase PrsW (M82 family)